jgi:N-acetylmuramoyl-L-alanine amidase
MRLIGWILGLVLLLGGAAEAAAKPAITDARLGVEPGLTRVVISLSQRSDFRVFTLADPYRVVIDMSEVEWKVPSGTKLQGQGLVAGMRYGLFKAGTSRVVLDLMEPSEVARAEFVPAGNGEPLRLLVDLRPIPDTQFRAQLKNSSVSYSAIAAIAPATKPAETAARPGPGLPGSGTRRVAGALGGSAVAGERVARQTIVDPGMAASSRASAPASTEAF